MNIRTFREKNLQRALARVRDELGQTPLFSKPSRSVEDGLVGWVVHRSRSSPVVPSRYQVVLLDLKIDSNLQRINRALIHLILIANIPRTRIKN